MGQQDVYDILKNNPKKWFSLKDLCKEIPDIGEGSIGASIRKMAIRKEILVKKVKTKKNHYNKVKFNDQ